MVQNPLAIGQILGNLHIRCELGRGAMGVVYLASHQSLDLPFAVKTVLRGGEAQETIDEARLAARVTSPHLVHVVDAGVFDDRPYLVQRYVDGLDLQEIIDLTNKAANRIPAALVCRLISEVSQGLHLVHQAGIVHRDIKPSNIFLDGFGLAKIGDFGVAFDPRRHTKSEGVGTPLCMSPEIWEGELGDRRSDIYSLGVTAHLLALGDPPFDPPTLRELADAHCKEFFHAPDTDDPVEAYLFNVIQRMLEKTPEARYQRASDITRALQPLASARPSFIQEATMVKVSRLEVQLEVGDLSETRADVLVNAANQWLGMELGVGRALADRGGPSIEEEAKQSAPAPMGAVVWTGPGKLEAKAVAHAVAALSGAICIQRCVTRVLFDAEARQYNSVAFPALGTGIGGVPMALGALLMLEAIRTFSAFQPRSVSQIRIVLHGNSAKDQWLEVLSGILGPRE